MTKKLILSTAYLPPVDYMAALLVADEILIEADESYSKQTYRNRCRIAGPNGVQSLSVPVRKGSKGDPHVAGMQITNDEDWRKLHWKSLETAYNSSPYFFYYQDEFLAFYEKKYTHLLDFNTDLLKLLLEFFQFEKEICFTTEFHKSYDDTLDLRNIIHPKKANLLSDYPPYMQVFDDRLGFQANLSILDLLFNKGPESVLYLLNLGTKLSFQ